MPHSLYLGSALATQDRISPAPRPANSLLGSQDSFNSDVSVPAKAKTWLFRTATGIRDAFCTSFRVPLASSFSTQATRHADRENRPYAIVIAHIHHGVVDMVINLMGFAVIINSFILILASAVFFYGDNQRGTEVPASLFDAYDLISSLVGKAAAILFAIALLASGQSSSIIATVAGQAVSEGFLHWRTSPAMRRIITRLIAIIPSMVVAVAVGQTGIDTLLVASQVVLSIVLPFVIIPLVYLTSSKSIMTVRKARTILPPSSPSHSSSRLATPQQVEGADADELVDFSNGWIVTGIGATICLIVVAANIYVLVTLGQGS
ncbi:hypothetical protein C0991_004428 [Blastosporella zonata]|nr:hypothetical protein C0991_004428 [Blastosporella zonata]